MPYKVKVLKIEQVTHDVKRFVIEKPENYKFIPGQATLVSIDKDIWRKKQSPFTFTSLNSDDFLEFTIKIYKDKEGVTNELDSIKVDEYFVIREPFGTINYKGQGIFIAGGAGITPFIAILRQLRKENKLEGNKLIFSNKTSKDVILEKEFREMFKNNPENLILTLTKDSKEKYENKKIDKEFLKSHISDFNQKFYICGPPNFVYDIKEILKGFGVKSENIIIEKDF